eukprot:jgi/Mesvir1/14921/Mv05514-RA.1
MLKDVIMGNLEPLQEHLDACLENAKEIATPTNFDVWRSHHMLTENNFKQLDNALQNLGEGNKLVSWLLNPILQKLSYRFYNGQLAEYHRLAWVRQLARDITNTILRVVGASPGKPQGGAGASSGCCPQASVASSQGSAGGPGDEDGGIIEMQWNKVYASVLQVLIDGIHSALSAITQHDLRTFARLVALLGDYLRKLARNALSRYQGANCTRNRYTYLSNCAPNLVKDVADNIKDAFQDYMGIWADKAVTDILKVVTTLSNMDLRGLGEGAQFDKLLQKFQRELSQLDGGREVHLVGRPRDEEPGRALRPRATGRPQPSAQAQASERIDTEDLSALRKMTVEEWVKYPVVVCRQVLVDLRIKTSEEMIKKCMQRRLLFKHLTSFLERNQAQPDRNVRPRIG